MIPENQCRFLIDEARTGFEELVQLNDFLKTYSDTLLSAETLDKKGVQRLKLALDLYFQNANAVSEMMETDFKHLRQIYGSSLE